MHRGGTQLAAAGNNAVFCSITGVVIMERDEFIETLKREGFAEVVTVTRDPHGTLDDHVHPFEAKALVIFGELTIRIGETDHRYEEGDTFHLQANLPHSEKFGPEGVQYLVGRK
jgi:quercetin dioxygenase-like cupin family protein